MTAPALGLVFLPMADTVRVGNETWDRPARDDRGRWVASVSEPDHYDGTPGDRYATYGIPAKVFAAFEITP